MSFLTCLDRVRENRLVSREEVIGMRERYYDYLSDFNNDSARAQAAFMDDMESRAYALERHAQLVESARSVLWEEMLRFRNRKGERDVGEYNQAKFEIRARVDTNVPGMRTLEGHASSILRDTMGELDAAIATFLGNINVRQQNKTLWSRVDRELFGEDTGDAVARAYAQAISQVFENLRLRANAAGMNIPKLDGWGRPVHHDLRRVYRARESIRKNHGQAELDRLEAIVRADGDSISDMTVWRAFVRELVDQQQMRHPSGRRNLTDSELRDGLSYAHGSIVSGGAANINPASRPSFSSSFAGRHGDERWLIWKDAEARERYERAFSTDVPFNMVMEHLRVMARDISAAELLGPDPHGMVQWMMSVARHQAGVADKARADGKVGVATLMPDHGSFSLPGADNMFRLADAGQYVATKNWRVKNMWDGYIGATRPVSAPMANHFATARNIFTGSHLGSTAVTAWTTDPAFSSHVQAYYGLIDRTRFGQDLHQYLRAANPVGRNRNQLIRGLRQAGFVLDTAMHASGGMSRYFADFGSSRWSGGVADRVLWVSGLKGVTQARKDADAARLGFALRDNAHLRMADLPEPFQELLTALRLTENDWEVIRHTRPRDLGGGLEILDARTVMQANRDVGERLLAGLGEMVETMVPTAGLRATSLMNAPSIPSGTFHSLLARSVGYLMSFPVETFLTQSYRAFEIAHRSGYGSMLKNYSSLIVRSTIGGIMATLIGDMAFRGIYQSFYDEYDGPDSEAMAGLVLRGFVRGGGAGFYGDLLYQGFSSDGRSIGENRGGPMVQIFDDVSGLTVGNAVQLARGEDPRFGRDLARFLKNVAPGSNIWYLRLPVDRAIYDSIQSLIDENADRDYRSQMSRVRGSQPGSEYWWQEGQALPEFMR